MSLNNNKQGEFSKDMLVKIKDEGLRNFLGYTELSNHFIGGINNEELRTFFFEKKYKDISSLTVLEVEEIVFNKIGEHNIKNIIESIYELNIGLENFIDNMNYILDKYHNSRTLNQKEISKHLKKLYKILDKLNSFIEKELLHLNSFLIDKLYNKTIKKLKNILFKIEIITRAMDELEICFGDLKNFDKFRNKFDGGFLQFLKWRIEDSKDKEKENIEYKFILPKEIKNEFSKKKVSSEEISKKEIELKKEESLISFDEDMYHILNKHEEIGKNMQLIITLLLQRKDIIDIVKINTILFQEIIEIILSNPAYTNKEIKKDLTKKQKELLYGESSSIILFQKTINVIRKIYSNTNKDINKLINVFFEGYLRLWENKVYKR